MSRGIFRLIVTILILIIIGGGLYIFRNDIRNALIETKSDTKTITLDEVDETDELIPLDTSEDIKEIVLPNDIEPTSTEADQVSALLDSTEPIPETPYEKRLAEAKSLIEHNYFSQASFEISHLLRKNPENIELYMLLGEIYLRTNDLERLDNLIDQMQTKFEGMDDVLLLQTRKWIQEEKFSLITTINTENSGLKFYQSILLAMQNDQEGAKQGFIDLFGDELDSDFTIKVNDFIAIYDEFGSLKEGKNAHLFALFSKVLAKHNEALLAKQFADLAIKEEISYIDAWVLRGYSFFLMQDYETALKDFQHAHQMDPTRPESTYFLGLTLYELDRFEESALYFEQILDNDFEFSETLKWKLVTIFSRQKKYEEALELYRQLLTPEAKEDQFISAIDMAVNLVGRSDVALEFTETLRKKDPNSIFSNNLYVWALIANEEYVLAEQILEKLLIQNPNIARTHLNYGLLLEKQSKYIQARESYKKAYEIGKNNDASSSIINLSAESYNKLLKIKDLPVEESTVSDPE